MFRRGSRANDSISSDAIDNDGVYDTSSSRMNRVKSVPTFILEQPSILRVLSVHESLGKSGLARSGIGNQLSFGKVQIRDYEVTVGDNPSVSSGPPISIGWQFHEYESMDLNEYENHRGDRRARSQLLIPAIHRTRILQYDWDVSRREVEEASRQCDKDRTKRKQTLAQMQRREKINMKITAIKEGAVKLVTNPITRRHSFSDFRALESIHPESQLSSLHSLAEIDEHKDDLYIPDMVDEVTSVPHMQENITDDDDEEGITF